MRGLCRCLWYARGSCLCPCVITPRGFTSLPTQEPQYCFSGLIPTNKQTNKQTDERTFSQGRFCSSIDLVCKVEQCALENSSVSLHRLSFHGFMQKRPRNLSITPELSVATRSTTRENSIIDFSSFEFQSDFSTKQTMKMMHRQTK